MTSHDSADAILYIRAGVGGDDATLSADGILRMYLKWAQRHKLELYLTDVKDAPVAGIRQVDCIIIGGPAYGLLKHEHGVHHIKRASPFDADGKVKTATVIVEVWPDVQAELNPEELRIDTYIAGCPPAGGYKQEHWRYAAVRVTHIPSQTVVEVRSERTTAANRDRAMRTMAIRLAMDKDRPKACREKVRTYVLTPHGSVKPFVKDYRTGWRGDDPQAVLDGDLDPIFEAMLRLN